jgi:pyruvate dehydrogenase E2 component (dihydrolipoamide acetyltransferase)
VAKIDVNIPDIGDFKDVPVIEVLVKPGDSVAVNQSLVTLESDKATMDVPSPVAGTVAEVTANVGDKVSMGALIARIDAAGAETASAARQSDPAKEPRAAPAQTPAAPAPAAPAPAAPAPAPTAAPAPTPASPTGSGAIKADFSGVFAGPAVRRLARELDLDLNRIRIPQGA